MDSSDTPVSSKDVIRPFEWLTSASSLKPLLDDIVERSETTRALHVGCGSSTVGEYLIKELNYDLVVNVDMDGPTLQQMENRWRKRYPEDARLVFCQVDLVTDHIPFPSGHFDVVIDKSTLDCTLCSDEATAGLLCEVYRSLNAEHGAYIVISFHSVDLLLPLLRDCPGMDWNVSHHIIQREVEDIIGNSDNKALKQEVKTAAPHDRDGESPWTTGSFQPTEGYRRSVNVMICRRRGSRGELDQSRVRHHIHETNDLWFQWHNPLLTRTRQDQLQAMFQNRSLDLRACYNVLFTMAEREHLTFEHFMEDWNAFLESRPNEDKDVMSFDTAVAFLQEMQ